MSSNKDIAIKFANGIGKGKTRNMFIDGNTIYSYGIHFPIAIRIGDEKILFNSDSYSTTTARHKAIVLRCLKEKVVYVYGCSLNNISYQIEHDKKEIERIKDKLRRCRTEHKKENYNIRIEALKHNINELEILAIPETISEL